MGLLGELGFIEAQRSYGDRLTAAEVDAKLAKSSTATRIVIERIEQQLRKLSAISNNTTGPAGPPGPPGATGPPGSAGTVLPAIREIPYPFVVAPSVVFPPDGTLPFGPNQACRITWCEIHCDPDFTAPTANTTFTLQNAPTAPTATAGVTILSGQRRGEAAMSLALAANQRLYIAAPAALNGAQNLWCLVLRGDLP